MLQTVKEFSDKIRIMQGDESKNIPENLIIEGINWAFTTLPTVPGLQRAFSKHFRVNLNAKAGVKWEISKDFRRLINIPMIQFFSIAGGGDPCKLPMCGLDPVEFYERNGIPELKQAGVPCQYTIEQEDDNIYLVIDRPSDCPLILDYIAYGYPKPVSSMDDMIDISAPIEHVIKSTLRDVLYIEAEDLAFAGAITDLQSNMYIPEAIQMVSKSWSNLKPVIIGG